MRLSFQMMDNTTGYQEARSKKGKKKTQFDINLPGEPPVMWLTRLTIKQLPRTSSKDQQSQTAHLGPTEEVDHWRGKIGQRTGTALTLAALFLAMLSVITTTVGANHTWWAYVPSPPLLSPVTWEDSSVPVFTNGSSLLLRPLDPSLPLKPEEGQQLSNVSVNYTVGTYLTPICMGVETHFLKRGLQVGYL